jgi:hypothetical protein
VKTYRAGTVAAQVAGKKAAQTRAEKNLLSQVERVTIWTSGLGQ